MDKAPQEPSSGFGEEAERDVLPPFPENTAVPEIPKAPEVSNRKSCPLAGICSQESCEWWVAFQDGTGQCAVALLALNTLPGRDEP
jgi:hypothetical protein